MLDRNWKNAQPLRANVGDLEIYEPRNLMWYFLHKIHIATRPVKNPGAARIALTKLIVVLAVQLLSSLVAGKGAILETAVPGV
jgi:hypothetical protein